MLATQNPVEVEGTYPLPEAQLDRFMFKIKVSYPSRDNEREICRRNVTDYKVETTTVIDESILKQMQSIVTKVVVSDHVYNAALDLTRSTRPEEGLLPAEMRDMVQWGAGPRASIALLMAAKARGHYCRNACMPRPTTFGPWRCLCCGTASSPHLTPKLPESITTTSSQGLSRSAARRWPDDMDPNDLRHSLRRGRRAKRKASGGGMQILDPSVVGRIGSFQLIAQSVVDGVMSGKHRSTHRGGCCEFSEHRLYAQGDEIRLIDWRLFARRDRPYVKLFDDETNLHAWLVVDSSASMKFGASTVNKFDYARMACACLGRLLLRQRDSVGLVVEVDSRGAAPRARKRAFSSDLRSAPAN